MLLLNKAAHPVQALQRWPRSTHLPKIKVPVAMAVAVLLWWVVRHQLGLLVLPIARHTVVCTASLGVKFQSTEDSAAVLSDRD